MLSPASDLTRSSAAGGAKNGDDGLVERSLAFEIRLPVRVERRAELTHAALPDAVRVGVRGVRAADDLARDVTGRIENESVRQAVGDLADGPGALAESIEERSVPLVHCLVKENLEARRSVVRRGKTRDDDERTARRVGAGPVRVGGDLNRHAARRPLLAVHHGDGEPDEHAHVSQDAADRIEVWHISGARSRWRRLVVDGSSLRAFAPAVPPNNPMGMNRPMPRALGARRRQPRAPGGTSDDQQAEDDEAGDDAALRRRLCYGDLEVDDQRAGGRALRVAATGRRPSLHRAGRNRLALGPAARYVHLLTWSEKQRERSLHLRRGADALWTVWRGAGRNTRG